MNRFGWLCILASALSVVGLILALVKAFGLLAVLSWWWIGACFAPWIVVVVVIIAAIDDWLKSGGL